MEINLLSTAGKETVLKIKEESEQHLKDIVRTSDMMTEKSLRMIQIFTPVAIAIFAYVFNDFSKTNNFSEISLVFICLFIIITIYISVLYKNAIPHDHTFLGSDPKSLVVKEIISSKKDEINLQQLVGNRIVNIQTDIDDCYKTSVKKLDRFETANKILFIGISSIFMASIFVYCISIFC